MELLGKGHVAGAVPGSVLAAFLTCWIVRSPFSVWNPVEAAASQGEMQLVGIANGDQVRRGAKAPCLLITILMSFAHIPRLCDSCQKFTICYWWPVCAIEVEMSLSASESPKFCTVYHQLAFRTCEFYPLSFCITIAQQLIIVSVQ